MSERWVPLDLTDCDPSPFAQFATWFDAAREVREREAIALVTATSDARPSARMVLLRHVDDATFGWFTNYDSRKGRELAQNPYAALLWYCEPLGRQIRIEGEVAKMSAGDSDRYFASRPRGHQIGAHASAQSATLETRAQLEGRVLATPRGSPPRPGFVSIGCQGVVARASRALVRWHSRPKAAKLAVTGFEC